MKLNTDRRKYWAVGVDVTVSYTSPKEMQHNYMGHCCTKGLYKVGLAMSNLCGGALMLPGHP
jgi:hypothetical protein